PGHADTARRTAGQPRRQKLPGRRKQLLNMDASPPGERYVGLISGTSMDGIDAVVVEFTDGQPSLQAALTHPFDEPLRAALDALRRNPDGFPVARLGRLDAALGDRLADAALEGIAAAGCRPADIRAIGSPAQPV